MDNHNRKLTTGSTLELVAMNTLSLQVITMIILLFLKHTYILKKNSYKRKKRNTDPHKNRTLTLIFTDNHCIPPFLLIENLSSESISCRLKRC